MRPADWSAAGFGSDPIPGDPDTVRHGGHSYLDIARTPVAAPHDGDAAFRLWGGGSGSGGGSWSGWTPRR